jgi:vacuolar-type H+-ATPase catalytic subunit A/Vma1
MARGNTVTTLSADESARWREASRSTVEGWVSEMAARGIDGARLYERARELIAQFEQGG